MAHGPGLFPPTPEAREYVIDRGTRIYHRILSPYSFPYSVEGPVMKVTTLRIPEETYSDLENEAAQRGLSVSEYVREIIAARGGGQTVPGPNTLPDEKQGTPVECPECGYSWDYGGSLARATCPSCGGKVPV